MLTEVAPEVNYAVQSMDRFWDEHARGRLEPAIAKILELGYPAAAIELAFDPDSYYFPQLLDEDGENPDIDDHAIPIVGMVPGQTYELPWHAGLHPLQIQGLRDIGYSYTQINRWYLQFGLETPLIKTSAEEKVLGIVEQCVVPFVPDEPEILIGSGPFLRLMYLSERQETELCPSGIAHELVHIVQVLAEPVRHRVKGLNDELKAYSSQAELAFARVLPPSNELRVAAEFENFRRRHLGVWGYEATPDFVAALAIHSTLWPIAYTGLAVR